MTDDIKKRLAAKDSRYAKLFGIDSKDIPKSTAKISLDSCVYLGERIPGQPCGSQLTRCNLHGDITTTLIPCSSAQRCCNGCPSKVDKMSNSPRFVAKPDDLQTGVVIGSFRWPELVDLQINVIRDNCGPVPILVSNDDPDGNHAIDKVCKKHKDVLHWPNVERIGHTGGDISAFFKSVIWGASRGIRWVTKLSQRFVVNRPRWLQDSANKLRLSGLPMATQRCNGVEMFDLRTECAMLDIGWWNNSEVLSRIMPRAYWADVPGGLSAERIIRRVLEDLLREIYYPWYELMGECRYIRDYPDVLWHCNTHEDEYRQLANKYGVKLPREFHCDGWHHERSQGAYRYG